MEEIMSGNVKRAMLATAGLAIALVGTAPATALAADAAADTPATAATAPTIGEIVVTANKRNESIQKVPVAIDAITGTALKESRLLQAVDLASASPNLSAKNAVGDTSPVFSLRGIGLNDFATNGTQPVGVYLDEVYQVSNSELGFQLMDMERVEVLKGPQGTLYGRNTTAGAISFITAHPKAGNSAALSLTGGNYGLVSADGFVNVQLGPNLYSRVSFSGERQFSGYFTNTLTGKSWGQVRRASWRGQLLWDKDQTSVLLNYHGGIDQSDNWYYKYVADASGTALGAQLQAQAAAAGPDIYTGAHILAPGIDNFSSGVTATITHRFDGFTVKSITDADFLDSTRQEDYGSVPVPNGLNNYGGHLQQYSQELRLTSDGTGPVKWIVGAFASYDQLRENDVFNETDNPIYQGYTFNERYLQKTTSLALFTNNDFALTKRLGLTLGLRYTIETKRYDGGTFVLASDPALAFDTCPCTTSSHLRYSEPTGKIGINYKLDNGLAYASFSRSYKAGGVTGFYVTDPGGKAPYLPEHINAGELGLKTEWLDHRLRANFAAFYYDYQNLQAFGVINGEFRIFNVERSRVYGGEIEVTALPTRELRLDVGLGLLNTRVMTSTVGGVAVGNRLGNSPQVELNVTPSYNLVLAGGYSLKLAVDVNYRSGTNYYVQADPRQFQAGYVLVAPRLTLSPDNAGWSASIWAKNVTDHRYYREIFNDGGSVVGFPAAPRTFGVTATYKWQ